MSRNVPKKQEQEHQMAWLGNILASAQLKNWYGSIEIKMEGGLIRHVLKHESLMPPTSTEQALRDKT